MKPSFCVDCGTPIVFFRTKRGRLIPIDADTVKPSHTRYMPGVHRVHFATCREIKRQRQTQREPQAA